MDGMTPRAEPKVLRFVAYLSGCVALAISGFLLEERRFIGFPDGFVADHDRIRKALLAVSSGVSLLACVGFVSLGWVGPTRIGKKLGVAGLVYGVFLALVLVADRHLHELSGRGG
jgi:hypothetical protein